MENSGIPSSRRISVIFSDCSLELAARQISAQSDLSISCPFNPEIRVNGSFKNQPVDLVVESIAKTLNLKVRWISDNFVSIYAGDELEKISLCVPAPFVQEDKLPNYEGLTVNFHNGYLLLSGEREQVKEYVKSINSLNSRLMSSFGAEVVLVRVAQRVYFDAAAQVSFSAKNLLAVSDISQLINIFARLDANFNKSKQVINAFAYLAEGQKTNLEVGSVRQRELKHISSEGYVSTAGYQEFKDGLQLELVCNSLSNQLYTLTTTISNSKFRDSNSDDVIPINDTSKLSSNQAIVMDNCFALLAMVSDRNNGNGGEVVGLSRQDSDNVLLIFCRVKRVNPSCFGLSIVDKIDIDSL